MSTSPELLRIHSLLGKAYEMIEPPEDFKDKFKNLQLMLPRLPFSNEIRFAYRATLIDVPEGFADTIANAYSITLKSVVSKKEDETEEERLEADAAITDQLANVLAHLLEDFVDKALSSQLEPMPVEAVQSDELEDLATTMVQ